MIKMTTSLVLVPCKLCYTRVPVSDLRRNKEGLYVCNTCLSHGFYESSLRTNQLRKPAEEIKAQPMIKKDDKSAFFCNSCKYRFTRPIGSPGKGCPFCGKEYSVQKRESAAELLKNVDDMLV